MQSIIFTLLTVALIAQASTHNKPVYGHTDYGDIHKETDAYLKKSEDIEGVDLSNQKVEKDEERYYWFNLWDHNEDEHLDGHELYGALQEGEESITHVELANWVDHILDNDDKNGDGMLSWEEYITGSGLDEQ
jgi:Ca2+-binding EF-hand superfamily protein